MRVAVIVSGLVVALSPVGRPARRPGAPGDGHARRPALAGAITDAVDGVGRTARLTLRLPPATSDRSLGVAAVAVLPAALLAPWAAPVVVASIVAHDRWRGRRRATAAADVLRRALPDLVDLLGLAVDAGATPLLALQAAARHADPTVADPIREVVRRTAGGAGLDDALGVLVTDLGEPLRPLVSVLRAANLDGAPLGPALARLADELRSERRRHAEAHARRLPVRLLFPLVCCALPALVLLSVVPLLVGTLRSLRL